jgi:hypothetical protein
MEFRQKRNIADNCFLEIVIYYNSFLIHFVHIHKSINTFKYFFYMLIKTQSLKFPLCEVEEVLFQIEYKINVYVVLFCVWIFELSAWSHIWARLI